MGLACMCCQARGCRSSISCKWHMAPMLDFPPRPAEGHDRGGHGSLSWPKTLSVFLIAVKTFHQTLQSHLFRGGVSGQDRETEE